MLIVQNTSINTDYYNEGRAWFYIVLHPIGNRISCDLDPYRATGQYVNAPINYRQKYGRS